MDHSRIFFTVGFWVIFSIAFDAITNTIVPDLSFEATIFLWFIGMFIGTIIVNGAWYWLRLRQR
jgi:hypothetical protein